MAAMFERRSLLNDPACPSGLTTPFVQLVFISGPYRAREQRVDAPGCTIGSSSENLVALPIDKSVSPLHAQLTFHDNAWWLNDEGSTTGTHLLVEDAGRAVGIGDVFRIARTELQLLAVVDRYAA